MRLDKSRDPTHPESEHHDPYARRHRHPDDEQTLNWGDFVKLRAPSDPYEVVSLDPGEMCPFPPHAVVEKEPTHHTKDENALPDPFKLDHADDTVVQTFLIPTAHLRRRHGPPGVVTMSPAGTGAAATSASK